MPFLVWFSNGHSNTGLFCPVFKWLKQDCGQNGLVLGWPVPAEFDHLKTRLLRFPDVYCIVIICLVCMPWILRKTYYQIKVMPLGSMLVDIFLAYIWSTLAVYKHEINGTSHVFLIVKVSLENWNSWASIFVNQAWYAEFLLEINLKILLRKTGARLNFKIALVSLHIDPGLVCRVPAWDWS
jgi:hypothetical protein